MKKPTKKNNGNGGGRKPLPSGNKKVPITTYIEEIKVDAIGKDNLKKEIVTLVDQLTNKTT